jgi:hypothetical protein
MSLISQHIPFAKLADLAEGILPLDERNASLVHSNGCSRCSARLERVGQVVNLMRTDRAEDAPRDAVARALGIFQGREGAKSATGLVRRVVAALSFDSFHLAPAQGVRSGRAATRQLLYIAGENELDLRITPGDEAWVVSGQVLGQEEHFGGEVCLEAEEQIAPASVFLNEQCEFTLPSVPAGSYTLRLRFSHLEIEIPDFELRA